jgi:hypothetical protein
MDVSSPDSGPSQSYLDQKRHSISDDLHLGQLHLDTKPMETCPEEKQTQTSGIFTNLRRTFWGQKGEEKKMDTLQVTKEPLGEISV